MHYAIIGNGGNVLEWFDDEVVGRRALNEMVRECPEAIDDLTLLAFDEAGMPVGEPIEPSLKTKVDIVASPWLEPAGNSPSMPVESEESDTDVAASGGERELIPA